MKRDFWSPHGGVGSNPTSDSDFYLQFTSLSLMSVYKSFVKLRLNNADFCVRMAERSKAPDSRTGSFLSKGTSGLHMEAWVQIPLLTESFTWALATRWAVAF